MINILSIDWDYFIRATAEQRALLFPDGGNENIAVEGNSLIWNRCYSHSAVAKESCGLESVYDISALDDEITAIYALVEKYKMSATKISVHESHKEIADVISNNFSAFGEINVFNIGFHHDCNTHVSLTEINCGNWARILLNEDNIQQLSWVKREDSDSDESDIVKRVYNNVQELHDNPETLVEGIGYIFLCRSGTWTPPHLDSEFRKMARHLTKLIGRVQPNGLIELSLRWTKEQQDEINALITQNRFMNDELMKARNNKN